MQHYDGFSPDLHGRIKRYLPDMVMEQARALDKILRDLFEDLDAFLERQAHTPVAGQDEACGGFTDSDLEVIRRLQDYIRHNLPEKADGSQQPPQPETAADLSTTGADKPKRFSNGGTD